MHAMEAMAAVVGVRVTVFEVFYRNPTQKSKGPAERSTFGNCVHRSERANAAKSSEHVALTAKKKPSSQISSRV